MSKNEPKVNFNYGQKDLKSIIKSIIKYKLNSCDRTIDKEKFNTVTPNMDKLKNKGG